MGVGAGSGWVGVFAGDRGKVRVEGNYRSLIRIFISALEIREIVLVRLFYESEAFSEPGAKKEFKR